jgi:hydroxymethylglutaryl-CoA lyase
MSGTPPSVQLREVGPRDGLQNEPADLPTSVKIELVERLAEAGLSHIEAASFVSPRAVPRMADGKAVMAGIRRVSGVTYAALTPNMKGFEAALGAGADGVAVFASATEGFSKANLNCTIAESLQRFAPVCRAARDGGLFLRGYVSCALGCPHEGAVAPARVAEVAHALTDLGCEEISLGDTIGVGTPARARTMIEAVAAVVAMESLAAHFHDTYGQALANVLAALEMGMARIDSSVGGLGGCPYAKGASGNLATEDLVYMLNGMGIETGVDLERLVATAFYICDTLGRAPDSRVARALGRREGEDGR